MKRTRRKRIYPGSLPLSGRESGGIFSWRSIPFPAFRSPFEERSAAFCGAVLFVFLFFARAVRTEKNAVFTGGQKNGESRNTHGQQIGLRRGETRGRSAEKVRRGGGSAGDLRSPHPRRGARICLFGAQKRIGGDHLRRGQGGASRRGHRGVHDAAPSSDCPSRRT